jgi:L-fuculose-phosphate aldolase
MDSDTILVTPTGCSKYLVKSDDMVLVDLEGRKIAGSRQPTSEIGIHLAVYHLRPDVNSVVHAHPPVATGFACAGKALDVPLCSEAVMTLGPVPLAPYATTGTAELAASMASLIPDHTAILMANHGAVAYGESLLDAFLKMETVEHFAHLPGREPARLAMPAGRACCGAVVRGAREVSQKLAMILCKARDVLVKV